MVSHRKLFITAFVWYQEVKVDKSLMLCPVGIMKSTYAGQYF